LYTLTDVNPSVSSASCILVTGLNGFGYASVSANSAGVVNPEANGSLPTITAMLFNYSVLTTIIDYSLITIE
jgi:hypothetical protein